MDRAESTCDCNALCAILEGGKSWKTEWVAFIYMRDEELAFPT
jgi:hypothetical protein